MLKVKVIEKNIEVKKPTTLLPEIIDINADIRKIINEFRIKE